MNEMIRFVLVPCGSGNVPCTPCDLWHLASNIVDFLLIGLAMPILAVALLVGGIIWLTSSGNPDQIKKGKAVITSSIIGVFIAFSGWLIVNTIINTLGQGELQFAWDEIAKCPVPKVAPPLGTQPPITVTPPAGTFQTEQEARAFFANAGIEINKNPCTPAQPTNCTDLKGLPISAAKKLAALATGGGFCISGGTEGEGTIHQTHGIGKPIVDVKPSCSGPVQIAELIALRNRMGTFGQAVCESQNGVLRSSNTSCLTSSRGTPFTASQLNQLNHVHVVFP